MARQPRSKKDERNLHFDQPKPTEEPKDPARTPVTQYEFSRQPPSAEDRYFLEKESGIISPGEASAEQVRPKSPPPRPQPPADRPNSIWQRITRAFSRKADTSWRP